MMTQKKSKADPYEYVPFILNETDLEDKVFQLKDINKNLKEKQLQLEQNLKEAQWEASYFRKKAQSVQQKMKKTNLSNIETNELNKLVGSLKNKNEFYRKENLKLRENVRKAKYNRPKSARQNTKHKASKQQLNTFLKEIRQSIKQNHEVNTNYGDHITLNEVREQLQEKQVQISFLTTKYEQLQSNLKAEKIIQEHALDQCKEYKIMLQQTQQTNQELQRKICDVEATQHEIESLKLYIKSIKGENTSLQERICKLTTNGLLGDQLQSDRISHNTLQSKENVINDLRWQLTKMTQENVTLKNIQIELKKDFEIIQKQNEEMKVKSKLFEDESEAALHQCKEQAEQTNQELQRKICDLEATQHEIESLKLYIKSIKAENTSLQERICKLTENRLLSDQLQANRISHNKVQLNENVIDDLKCELTKMRQENETLKNTEIELKKDFEILQKQNEEMKVKSKLFEDESGINLKDLECALDLIEKSKRSNDDPIEIDKCDDPIILREKMDELLIKNSDLIVESTQNQHLLETQINFNKKMEKEYIALKNDHNNIKSEMFRLNETRNRSNLLISENELFIKSDLNDIMFTTTDNLITFKVLYIELNPNCSYFKGNINPLTMIIVDFFEFESVYSNIYGGYHPKYNLFCQYKIKMDDFFVKYIEKEHISIELVYKINNKFNIISNNKISLKNLLITPDSCIQNEVELISNNDDEEYIAKLSFIAKMLRSLHVNYNDKRNHDEDQSKTETFIQNDTSSTSIIDSPNRYDKDPDDIDSLFEQEFNKIETLQNSL